MYLSWKFPSSWITFKALQSTTAAAGGEKSSMVLTQLCAINYNSDLPGKICPLVPSVMTTVGATNSFLAGNFRSGTVNLDKSPELGSHRPQGRPTTVLLNGEDSFVVS